MSHLASPSGEPVVAGMSYPRWWIASWWNQCSGSRRLFALLLLPLLLIPVLFLVYRVSTGTLTLFDVVILLWLVMQSAWPFLLVIAAPSPDRQGRQCCAGCGRIDATVQWRKFDVGFALFGLIPIGGLWERPLCAVCCVGVYRIAIIGQNLFAVICLPVGTVFGCLWLIRNQRRLDQAIHETDWPGVPGTAGG